MWVSSWYIAGLLFSLRLLAKFEIPARISNKTCLNLFSSTIFDMTKTVLPSFLSCVNPEFLMLAPVHPAFTSVAIEGTRNMFVLIFVAQQREAIPYV